MNIENKIIINSSEFYFKSGETILQVAERNGIDIPTLCHIKGYMPTGACRICLVEVNGTRNLLPSCATPAAHNAIIETESERVIRARRINIELLLASGHHNCLTCEANGDCRLQELAYRYQVEKIRFPESISLYPTETSNALIIRDFSRCILCGRCVQACNEIQVNSAISYGYRGVTSKIVAVGDLPLNESDCIFCGECVGVCPVGALIEKPSRFKGRAWELKKIKTTCPYCGVGCQINLHIKDNKIVKVTGVEDGPPIFWRLWVKGRFGYEFINHPDRLTVPLIKENGRFREASWNEALSLVAERLGEIKLSYGPDSIGVFSSAKITNEENYLAQKFARAVLGTNNIDHCARLCHASTVAGLAVAFGSGAMTNPIADIEKSELILVTGSNTTEAHPVISSFIKRAVEFGRAKLIVIDPRKIPLAKFATLWLRQSLGTDVAWANGMMHVIIKENLYDKAYVESRTEGFEELKKTVKKYTPEYVFKITGIPADDLIKAARMYANARPASIFFAMGITQHRTGTDNVKSMANLSMLCGNVGIPGGGVNPLRGQNNVQGACDLGALPNVFSGYQTVSDAAIRERMAETWNVESLPASPGLTVTEMVIKAGEGKIKALYIIGENPLVSDPDLNHAEKALANLDFLVVQDIFLSDTAKIADVVLPSASFAEKDGTFTNTERHVQRVHKVINPPGKARQDWKIICDLSTRMGYTMTYRNSDTIMKEINRVTPSYGGISYTRLEKEGLHWPCPTVEHPGTPRLHVGRFTRGLGLFHSIDYIPPAELPDKEYPLYLTTGRVLYHFHTGTMTMQSEGLNGLAPECFVEISSEDARNYNVKEGDLLRVSSRRGEITAKARISDQAIRGTIFIPFHFAKAAANKLTNAALDPVAKIPEFKVCAVRIEKAWVHGEQR
ncbi:MAG: formate dehydrogenase subunit alpha [Deltaproteobacteria bacterium]|nr:MAG: formate dehydrogenase subunit alpha [Deltaproteobacteria bacterium]